MGQQGVGSKLLGYITISGNGNIPIEIENYLDGSITYFKSKGNKINLNKPILNEQGEQIIENVVGASCLIEDNIISPNKFWIYTEDNKKYILSFPMK